MDVNASVHSILSPSGADRWSTCLGALAACKGITETRSSEAAALGSAKHQHSERLLREPYERLCDHAVGTTTTFDGFEFVIDDDFADHVNVYLAYVRSRPGVKRYEVRISTEHIFGVPNQGGTIDCEHLDAAKREIEIIDAKFGYVPISAKHRQLRIYGAAALTLHDLEGEWDTVRCTVVQPQDSPPIKSEVFTRAQIEDFIADIKPKAQKAWELYQNPPADLLKYLTPSDEACNWCPIAGPCAARANRITNMFANVTAVEPDVVLMTDARIAKLYTETADIVEWAKAIAAEAESRALRGVRIPDHKLVWGRKGKRVYAEGTEDNVRGVLEMALGEDDMYLPRKLVSPTQAEAALKTANAPALYAQLIPFVTQSDPKLRLVPETAKGDAVTVTKVEFEVVK